MAQAAFRYERENASQHNSEVPQWLLYLTSEQFVTWCRKHKLQVCTKVREFPAEERIAIYRYLKRSHLLEETE